MPVNGLLITLEEDETLVEEVLKVLDDREGIEIGERTGRWLPVVVEAEDAKGSHDVHEWIESLSGVVIVDVVFTSVGDIEEGADGFQEDCEKQAHLQNQIQKANHHESVV